LAYQIYNSNCSNLDGHPILIDILTADWWFLEKFGKAIIFTRRVAINTDDFVKPSRQTRHSDPDLVLALGAGGATP